MAKKKSRDKGPLVRLLRQKEFRNRYDSAWILTTPAGRDAAEGLCADVGQRVKDVHLRVAEVEDPSDHAALFAAVSTIVAEIDRAHPAQLSQRDVVLSAGTPQAQTIWVILVQAGLLDARMLQVIPPAFVPQVHPHAVRSVCLDIEGFPQILALRSEVNRLRATVKLNQGPMVGDSPTMHQLMARVARVAATDASALILGETGAGKELVARAIHDSSERAQGPFIAENCGAFAEGLLASELFGHEAGAFTGAAKGHRGLFEQAHGGTLFLDEIAEMEPRVQAHLLRVLQDGSLRRVGGERQVKVDVRIIAATHRDVAQLVQEDRFREDLYYRLRGATLEVPPLRQRQEDIPLLVEHFLSESAPRATTVSPEAMSALKRYAWPGNVRELRTEVLRWGIFCGSRMGLSDLAPEILGGEEAKKSVGSATQGEHDVTLCTLRQAVEDAERSTIECALAAKGGNLSATARALNIDRNTLKRKLAKFELQGQ